jgi:glycosyltransferase involved in cell wall biosynthesis
MLISFIVTLCLLVGTPVASKKCIFYIQLRLLRNARPGLGLPQSGRIVIPAKILHLFVSLPVGGAENLLLSILKNLDPQRFQSLVCCIGERGALGERVIDMGTDLVELHRLRQGGWDGAIVRELAALITKEKVALVHSHLYHANLYGRLAAAKAGVPAIVSVHNTYTKPKWHRRAINWYLSRHTSAIIAGSAEIKRDVVRFDHVQGDLVEVIPNSVDLSRSLSRLTAQQARDRLGLPPGCVVLGTVGRLEEQKGHRYLLQALALLHGGMDVRLLLIGEGRERMALESLVRQLHLDEQVIFLGTRSDLGDLFRAMDLFVMPSLWEGLSLAMLSAMAAEVPVLATSVGGVTEVLGDDQYGRTVLPGDARALAEGIMDCLQQKEASRQRAILARKRVEDHYSDRSMVARLEAVYQRILEGGQLA